MQRHGSCFGAGAWLPSSKSIVSHTRSSAAALHSTRLFGPGCFESTYSPCLAYEMLKRGLQFEAKVELELRYEELWIPRAYEADFVVEGVIVIEVKALQAIAPVHLRQLRTYLTLTGCPLGLLMNFGAETMKDGVHRVVNN